MELSQSINQSITSDKLKTKLKSIGISEDMLETALPNFNESDTLKTLLNGEQIAMLNMTKLCRIKIKQGESREELIKKLKDMPEVLYAELNGLVTHLAIPSDIRFNEQWGLKNTVNIGEDIHAVAAWDIYTGNPNNIIGIIDGGTDAGHSDLNDKVAGGDNGYGWDGHGIHVSGIAAAESNNGQGISGVDWNAKIHAQRIDNVSDDAGTYQAIVDAVNYSPNLHILNHSWSLISGYDAFNRPLVGRYSITVRQAFAYAYKANRTSVVAMGNHQEYQANVVGYPAGFDNIITVGATTYSGAIANYSAQGGHIDVSAPGSGILSTYTSGSFEPRSGTSMATPHVSGLASLLKGYNPNLSNDDIENIIKLGVDDKEPPGFDNAFGSGRVNAERALNYLRSPYVLNQVTTTGGTVYSTSGNYTQQFLAAHPNLASGNYVVKRREVRKNVTFPTPFCQLVGVWGSGVGSIGWSIVNPNYGEGFVEVVPGTASNTSATLRTYVYEVFNILGQYLGYYPTTPANVTFKYSVLGIPGTAASITGSSLICTTGSQFTLSNPPVGLPVTWSATPSNLFSVSSGSGTSATLTASSTSSHGSATLTYFIENGCGSLPIMVSKILWVGIPSVPSSISSFCCNGMEFGSESIYEFTVNYANNQSVNQFNWVVAGGIILEGQGTNTIFVKTSTVEGSQIIYFDVSVRVGNNCGWSSYLWRSGYVTSGVGPAMFSVYPNPANSEVTVSVSEANSLFETTVNNEDFSITNIKILDLYGNIKKTKKYEAGQKSITINVSDLQKGIYLIIINYGIKEESHKLLIE